MHHNPITGAYEEHPKIRLDRVVLCNILCYVRRQVRGDWVRSSQNDERISVKGRDAESCLFSVGVPGISV